MTPTFGKLRFGAANGVAPLSMGLPPASYPGAIATNAQLAVAVDRLQTRLAAPLSAIDTLMQIESGAGIVASCLLTIDNEIIQVLSGSGTSWTISRGFDGTTAALHLGSSLVSGFIDAWHHNTLVAEVQAIEAALGPNLSRIPTAAFIVAGQYAFAPQSPGIALTVGANVITLSPVPQGVNGSDLNHFLWITGGTGTPEAVPITGGSAVSGAASGTLFITCAFAHSGAWTIGTATSGGKEAEMVLSATGGTMCFTGGTHPMHAPWIVDASRVTITGSGTDATILMADVGVSPVIQFGSAQPVNQCYLRDLKITRPSVGSASSIGIQWKNWAYCGQSSIHVSEHGIGESIEGITVQFFSERFLADMNVTTNLRIIGGAAGIWFHQSVFGSAGETAAQVAPRSVTIGGTSNDIDFDDANFLPQTSPTGKAKYGIYFENWTGIGLVTLRRCHWENYDSTGAVLFFDAGSLNPHGLMMNGCSSGDPAVPWVSSPAAPPVAVGWQIINSLVGGPLSFTAPLWLQVTGCFLGGIQSFTGGSPSTLMYSANISAASATFSGAWNQLQVDGQWYAGASPDFSGAVGAVAYTVTVDPSAAAKGRFQTQGAILNQGSDPITSDPPVPTNPRNGWKDVYFVGAGATAAFGLAPFTAYFRESTYYGWGSANPNGDGGPGNADTATTVAIDVPNGLLKFRGYTARVTENFIASQAGANNAITAALNDVSGVPVPLANGLKVTIKLSASTLQAGANTLNLNGLGIKNIRSSRNPANNIAAAYAVGSVIALVYDGTQFLDLSQ